MFFIYQQFLICNLKSFKYILLDIIDEDISAFKTYLNDIWFGLYSRQRHVLDSCGLVILLYNFLYFAYVNVFYARLTCGN